MGFDKDKDEAMVEFLQNNWFWLALILVFVGMHSFGGGCCGGGRKEKRNKEADGKAGETESASCH